MNDVLSTNIQYHFELMKQHSLNCFGCNKKLELKKLCIIVKSIISNNQIQIQFCPNIECIQKGIEISENNNNNENMMMNIELPSFNKSHNLILLPNDIEQELKNEKNNNNNNDNNKDNNNDELNKQIEECIKQGIKIRYKDGLLTNFNIHSN